MRARLKRVICRVMVAISQALVQVHTDHPELLQESHYLALLGLLTRQMAELVALTTEFDDVSDARDLDLANRRERG